MRKITEKQDARQFRRAMRINLNRNHARNVAQRAEGAREAICDMVIQGKLDAIDLQIIEARDCSPMPTESEVGVTVGISQQAVHKRVVRFQRLFASV
jgi:uncharacterized membrane protein